jgi:uncharacterized membrane protein
MFASEFFSSSLWWIFPILMIALCFFMMRRRKGSMMCGFGSRDINIHQISASDSAIDILDKRYAFGDISKKEYEDRKRTVTDTKNQ